MRMLYPNLLVRLQVPMLLGRLYRYYRLAGWLIVLDGLRRLRLVVRLRRLLLRLVGRWWLMMLLFRGLVRLRLVLVGFVFLLLG